MIIQRGLPDATWYYTCMLQSVLQQLLAVVESCLLSTNALLAQMELKQLKCASQGSVRKTTAGARTIVLSFSLMTPHAMMCKRVLFDALARSQCKSLLTSKGLQTYAFPSPKPPFPIQS